MRRRSKPIDLAKAVMKLFRRFANGHLYAAGTSRYRRNAGIRMKECTVLAPPKRDLSGFMRFLLNPKFLQESLSNIDFYSISVKIGAGSQAVEISEGRSSPT